jgi:phospholipase/carboxylesterase
MPSTPLHHVVYKVQQAAERGAPLLLLLHGYGSNEEDLVGLAPHLDGRFVCASARAARTRFWRLRLVFHRMGSRGRAL